MNDLPIDNARLGNYYRTSIKLKDVHYSVSKIGRNDKIVKCEIEIDLRKLNKKMEDENKGKFDFDHKKLSNNLITCFIITCAIALLIFVLSQQYS